MRVDDGKKRTLGHQRFHAREPSVFVVLGPTGSSNPPQMFALVATKHDGNEQACALCGKASDLLKQRRVAVIVQQNIRQDVAEAARGNVQHRVEQNVAQSLHPVPGGFRDNSIFVRTDNAEDRIVRQMIVDKLGPRELVQCVGDRELADTRIADQVDNGVLHRMLIGDCS